MAALFYIVAVAIIFSAAALVAEVIDLFCW